ncbi:MAG: VCBS repeat-containing protein [Verrucomicrobia bacterium]|nr:VCBS repeat-containing protein [Verrucomicrobiota bacterium]
MAAAAPRCEISGPAKRLLKSSLLFLLITAFSLAPAFLSAAEWEQGDYFRSRRVDIPGGAKTGFTRLASNATGIAFGNFVPESKHLTNQIFLNGSGVAAGDVDGDGRCDLYFCGLTQANRLYRNLGDWTFEDITEKARVACSELAATGAAFADLDGDFDLELIVNSVGGGTHIFINNGKGHFSPLAPKSGINERAGGTSLALGDTDGDGFLELYIANYRTSALMDIPNARATFKVVQGKTIVERLNGRLTTEADLTNRFVVNERGAVEELGEPDVLYRNLQGTNFVPISFTQGAFLDEAGQPLAQPPRDWGLTAVFRDMNRDGLPDIYVCNDFETPDRTWINLGQGRFQALSPLALRKSSFFSMGMDFADINRDGFDDFLVLDMLPRDHRQRMVQMGTTLLTAASISRIDSRPQYMLSTLFLNRGDNTYAEIGQLAGLEASDWAWSPVFLDVDLDGWEDVLLAAGQERAARDMDVTDQLRALRAKGPMSDAQIFQARRMFPRLESRILAFRNRRDLTFEEIGSQWGFKDRGVSHGMALADLDDDGDLDLVVNHFNAPAGIYRNDTLAPRLAVRLKGKAPNTRGIGARITVSGGTLPSQSQEMICGGRYMSCDETIRMFACGGSTNEMTIEVIWRSGSRSLVRSAKPNRLYEVDEAGAVGVHRPRAEGRSEKLSVVSDQLSVAGGQSAPGGAADYVIRSPQDRLHVLPPHPGPLPRGEGESFAAIRPVELNRRSDSQPALFPLPEGEGQGEGEHDVQRPTGVVYPRHLSENYPEGAATPGLFNSSTLQRSTDAPIHQSTDSPLFEDVSERLNHIHQDEPYDDFGRQPLLPYRLSQLGPGVAWFDFDEDGWDDLIVGTGKGGRMGVFRNEGGARFPKLTGSPLNLPVTRDQTTVLGWIKAPGRAVFLAGSSNYKDGMAIGGSVRQFDLARKVVEDIVPAREAATGPLAMADIDGDGDLDLFVGGRVIPGKYPKAASSALFRSAGGKFEPDLGNSKLLDGVGLVSGAMFSDLNGDGFPELILACDWGPIRLFRNDAGRLAAWDPDLIWPDPLSLNPQPSTLNSLTGWWNGVTTGDFDGDGELDIVAANWGRNSQYQSHRQQPLRIYFGDVDGDGTHDLIEAYSDLEVKKIVPERQLGVLGRAIPILRDRFRTHKAYAEASVEELLGDLSKGARHWEANWLESTIFLNRGNRFEARVLPVEAQFAPAFGACTGDCDGDGREDLFLSQNFFAVTPETPRYDGGRGLWLKGDGQGGFAAMSGQESGVKVYGEQRGCALADFDRDGRVDLVVTQNGNATKLYRNLRAWPGLRIRLKGPDGNPNAVGAILRLAAGNRKGPAREIHAGSGYWSQDSSVQVMASSEVATRLEVRWPGGKLVSCEISSDARELSVDPTGGIVVSR